jgi:membrane associated rhomboid family serine protease
MVEASVGHQCPECVAEGRRSVRPARTAFGGGQTGERGLVTRILIAINVGALVLAGVISGPQAIFSGSLFTGTTELTALGGVLGAFPAPPATAQVGIVTGEYYRLFTAIFLHYGIFHLLMNMYALWILGRVLEAALGPARFVALYLVAGLGGSVAIYLFSTPDTLGAGASGAIFGLFAAIFVILRKLKLSTASVLPILLINLVLTFTVPGISVAGHLGGLITGGVVAAGLAYAPAKSRTAVQIGAIAAVSVVLLALTIWRTATLGG